ncbi:hypothetical protein BJX70DRAFT_337930 [Aspergillus crustosus]
MPSAGQLITNLAHDEATTGQELPLSDPPHGTTDGNTDTGRGGEQPPLTGPNALLDIIRRERWDNFGFVLFRTFYRDESLWLRFVKEYEPLLRSEITFARSGDDAQAILDKLKMDIVSDDCMDDKIPEHISMAYRMFSDVEPGLQTKMCLVVDQECMESVAAKSSSTVPFVKAVDVVLGADAESAFPRVIKVAVSSLLARFYPALANCDTVWEIASDGDDVWIDWPGLEDGAE